MKKIIILTIAICLANLGFANQIFTNSVDLEVTINTGKFGIPDGIDSPGKEAWLNLSDNLLTYTEFGTKHNGQWDILFTYVVRTVSMGPMGKKHIPFFAARVNDKSGASFYMVEESFDSVTTASTNGFKTEGWSGYGHQRRWKNKILDKEIYKTVFPYLSYDWYEFKDVKSFEYIAYAGRTFIIRSNQGEYYKLEFTQVKGSNGKTLFSADFRFSKVTAE